MAYTDIDDPSEYFQAAAYSGNSSTLAVTSQGNATIAPDWIWIKRRSSASTHALFDSTRGRAKSLGSEATDAEFNTADTAKDLISFDTDGFTVGPANQRNTNGAGQTFVAWQWKANGGTTASNTDGDITSTVQANTDAGFSIVTWTSTGGNESIGHGLGVVPAMFIIKNRSAGANWKVYHDKNTSAPQTDNVSLNKTDATQDDAAAWNDTAPTSTTFTVGTDAGSGGSNTNNMVAYCFAEKQGYSKFGSYIGNGVSNNGTFAYTGFSPSFVMIKRTDSAASWLMFDNKRGAVNMVSQRLYANATDAEDTNTADGMDFVSNGFKIRSSTGGSSSSNASGASYIYMAFAEHPFVSSQGVPTTAR